MTSDQQSHPEQKPARTEIKTLSLKTTLTQFAMVAIMLIGAWWFHGQLTDQSRVTDEMNERANELGGQIADAEEATGQISKKVNKSVTELSQRLKSVENELQTAKKNLNLVEQRATDVAATQAVSDANASRVKYRADQITQQLAEFTRSLQIWNRLIEETRNRPGELAEQFTQNELTYLDELLFQRHDERSKQQIKHWQEQLAILMTPVNEVIESKSDGTLIPADNVKEIDDLADEIQREQKHLKNSLDSLQALTEKFRAPYPPEVGSLQDMVLRNRLVIARERNTRSISHIADRQKELDTELEQAVAESMQSLNDARILSQQLQTAIQEDAIKLEDAIRDRASREQAEAQQRESDRQQQEAARLVERQKHQRAYEQALPEIRQLLVPFLAAGSQQLNGTDWVQSDAKVPLSYAGIRATGSLTNDGAGHRAFLWLAGGPYNDRPNGVFPAYIGGDVSNFGCMGSIRRGQVLLDKYGELLVANRLLAP